MVAVASNFLFAISPELAFFGAPPICDITVYGRDFSGSRGRGGEDGSTSATTVPVACPQLHSKISLVSDPLTYQLVLSSELALFKRRRESKAPHIFRLELTGA